MLVGRQLRQGHDRRRPRRARSSITPASPSNDDTPTITGTAEAGLDDQDLRRRELRRLADRDRRAPPPSPRPASPSPCPTTRRPASTANATDVAGNTSPCSSPLSYVKDSTPPAAPSALTTDPPAVRPTTTRRRSAAAPRPARRSSIYTRRQLHRRSPVASGSAAAFASGLAVDGRRQHDDHLDRDGDRRRRQRLTAARPASTYVNDSTAPAAPSGLATRRPRRPTTTRRTITGSAEAGSTVKLYASAACSGSPVATGTAADLRLARHRGHRRRHTTSTWTRDGDRRRRQRLAVLAADQPTSTTRRRRPRRARSTTTPASPANDDTPSRSPAPPRPARRSGSTRRRPAAAPPWRPAPRPRSRTGLTVTRQRRHDHHLERDRDRRRRQHVGLLAGADLRQGLDARRPRRARCRHARPRRRQQRTRRSAAPPRRARRCEIYATRDCAGTAAATGTRRRVRASGLTSRPRRRHDDAPVRRRRPTPRATRRPARPASRTSRTRRAGRADRAWRLSPASPANNNAPKVSGSAEAGSTVAALHDGRLHRLADRDRHGGELRLAGHRDHRRRRHSTTV